MLNGGSKGNRHTPLTPWLIAAIAVCLSSGSCGKPPQEEAAEERTDSVQTHRVSEVTDSVHGEVPTPKTVDGHPEYPTHKHIVWPDYPQEIKDAGIEGMVFVRALVDTDGMVKKTELVRSLHSVLDTSALEAVSHWEFIPLMMRQRPIKTYTAVGVRFRKDDLPLPDYPEIAVDAGIQGTVIARLLIASDGGVAESQIIESAHPALDRVVTEAATHWKFWPPGESNGDTVMTVMVPVRFTLSGGVRGGPKETWNVRPEGRVELVWPKGYLASRRRPGAAR